MTDTASLLDDYGDVESEMTAPVSIATEIGENKSASDHSPPVSMFKIFKYSDCLDRLLMLVGILNAIACGSSFPVMFVLFGDVTKVFITYQMSSNETETSMDDIQEYFWAGLLDFFVRLTSLGLVLWITHYLFVYCLNRAAARQTMRIRRKFFLSVLQQDMAWYDTNSNSEFSSSMTENLNKIQDGIGEKLGMFFRFFFTFLLSFIYAFYENWKVSAALCAVVPIMIILGGSLTTVMVKIQKSEMDIYRKVTSIVEEVFMAVKTVIAFRGEDKEVQYYSDRLKEAESKGIKRGLFTGLTIGSTFGLMFCIYGFGFWFGVNLFANDLETERFQACQDVCVENDEYRMVLDCIYGCFKSNPGSVAAALFGILQGGMQIGQSFSFVESFNMARVSAGTVFKVIDRKSNMLSRGKLGHKPKCVKGDITLKSVFFNYPARSNVTILRDVNIKIEAGQTVGLVGSSGSGKSTCVKLISRFYDPVFGEVLLDGNNVKELNVNWLRKQIGIVSQDPILFNCTIRENIRYANPKCTENDMIRVCQEANAYDFIMQMPDKFDTKVGESGAQLSGGQRQRIAIARALVRNPAILLFDEATSALDNSCQHEIQETIRNLHAGRTVIIIAHRLSTIMEVDKIYVLDEGKVIEEGCHNDLLSRGGKYRDMFEMQAELRTFDEPAFIYTEDSRKNDAPTDLEGQTELTEEHDFYNEEQAPEMTRYELFKRLLQINKKEWPYLTLGIFAALMFGAINVFFSVIFGNVLNSFTSLDPTEARREAYEYAIKYVLLGCVCFLSISVQNFMFAVSGERLSRRIRVRMYRAMLSQQVAWHDIEENGPGALCSRLASNAQHVQGATGAKIGHILQSLATIVMAFFLGLSYNWKVALVSFTFIPFILVGMVYQMILIMKMSAGKSQALENANRFACEAINNIQTVAALNCEQLFFKIYKNKLNEINTKNHWQGHIRGIMYGFANSSFCFAYAVCFLYGGHVYMQEADPSRIMEIWKIAIAVLNGALFVGIALSFVLDFNLVFPAARSIFQLLDQEEMAKSKSSGTSLFAHIRGNIEMIDGEFSYPNRRDVKVLNKLNFDVKAGERVAIVGLSGCGKSTVIQLIHKLYDLDDGGLEFERCDVRNLSNNFLSSKLSLVSQEPTLFNRSISDNIRYGDNASHVSMERVIQAAKAANIHDFVMSLPEGYATHVGNRGTQLSGGQKQRVAIARALIKKPKILVLDEATSALDTNCEHLIQKLVSKQESGRTVITVTHRLTTIVDYDKILVLANGRVLEWGTHEALLEKRGLYHRLWNVASIAGEA